MDTLTKSQRSERMSRVRSRGNASTELKVETALLGAGIQGWEKHPDGVRGKPDFFFEGEALTVFIDGCFWHGCPRCRRIPKTKRRFWRTKIAANRRRDRNVSRALNRMGMHVVRIWEHCLDDSRWLDRIRAMLGIAETVVPCQRRKERRKR